MRVRALYLLLAMVAAVAISSQVLYTIDVAAEMQGRYPFPPVALGDPWPTIRGVNPQARDAGLRVGERVAAVDGEPVRGLLDFYRRVRSHAPGESLAVTVLRGGEFEETRVPMPRANFRPYGYYAVIAWLFM